MRDQNIIVITDKTDFRELVGIHQVALDHHRLLSLSP